MLTFRQMDLADETLADQFLDIANSNINDTIEEVNCESINNNALTSATMLL